MGAVLTEADLALLAGTPARPSPVAPELQVVAFVAAEVLPSLPSFRSIVGDAVRTGRTDVLATVFEANRELANRVLATKIDPLVAWHAACTAELQYQARDFGGASGPLGTAQTAASGDLAALAHVALVWGDWQAEPLSHPEVLGLTAPPIGSISFTVDRDVAAARQSYLRAGQAYTDAGSTSGRAAVALRLAHLARLTGDVAARDHALADARALADTAGDGALAQLAEVQSILDRVGDGQDAGAAEVDALADWATTDGSTSWGRGLCKLLLDRALAWRQSGEFIAARRALRLAERLADRVGAAVERPMVDRSIADLYGGVNYRRASLVLADLEIEAAIASFDLSAPDATPSWMQLADRAMTVHSDAIALVDPDLITASARRLDRLLEIAPPVSEDDGNNGEGISTREFQATIEATLRTTRAQADVLVPLYRGRLAMRDGLLGEAATCQSAALGAAEALGDPLLECIALAHARRFDEARELATGLFREGKLTPDVALNLFVQVRAPELAEEALQLIDAAGGPPPSTRPWEVPGLRAEVFLGLGRFEEAVAAADGAIAAFEERRTRLARDILRTSATDDPSVASLYHVGILARLELSDASRAEGDGARALRLSLEALDLADRLRGSVLSIVAALDRLGDDPASRRVARRWLRAGSAWAAAFEELSKLIGAGGARTGAASPDPATPRERLEAAEEELDDAETEVAAVAPDLLSARSDATPSDPTTLPSAIQAETVLLATYSFADDLVVWAVSPDAVRHGRSAVPAHDLAGRVRRFHAACAERTPVPGDEADALAALLLEPFVEEIGAALRVVVVPHGGLTLLPFHALPFGKDVLGSGRAVSYLPSAGLVLRPAGRDQPRLDGGALVVGDPAYAPSRGLTRLPGTATEAREVGRVLGSEPLLEDGATEAAVVENAFDRAVLHLATHGFVDGRGPNLSYLALAGEDALTVGDVMGLDARADLVVFSACHSGRGTATAGGDLIGLVRAAVAAGAKHLVVSLWPVDDEAGCLVVCDFYRRLSAGERVSEALAHAESYLRGLDRRGRRTAYEALCAELGAPADVADGPRDIGGVLNQETIDDAAHPYHWAPFVHVGLP